MKYLLQRIYLDFVLNQLTSNPFRKSREQVSDALTDFEQNIASMLPPETSESIMLELESRRNELALQNETEVFSTGFKMGASLMCEILNQ